MRTKLTAITAVLGATVALGAASALAGPVTVALYSFQTQGDVLAFQKAAGAKCAKKWSGNKQMAITVGRATTACVFRSSVVGDSTDPGSDAEVSGVASVGSPAKLQKKAYAGVGTRQSETAGWELRVRPAAQSWQLFRDPKGAAGPTLYKSGKGKFIRLGAKPNTLLLRTFDFNTNNTQILATINGKRVLSATDSAADQPDGRRTVVTAGAKGTAPGTGIVGYFDDVAIKVPNPF